jgi:ribosome-associated toxin RatA of RatAB toxin-antitoxin module
VRCGQQVLSAIAAIALLAAAARTVTAGTGRDLSKQERASLEAGALVSRPQAERRGSLDLIGGTSYQVINAPLRVVWSALLDTQYYPRMMPQVTEARLVEATKPNERTVFIRQGAGPIERTYYLSVRLNEAQGDISFRVDERRPHTLRAAWGFYNVRQYADTNKTLLAYGVMADLDVGVLGSWLRGDVHEWLLKVPWTVKRFVEGSGRHIYKHTWRDSLARLDGAGPQSKTN